jgi:hypothetical protein
MPCPFSLANNAPPACAAHDKPAAAPGNTAILAFSPFSGEIAAAGVAESIGKPADPE